MYRLGLRLTLRSGREPLIRLLVTMTAVGIGVAILFSVLADFNAFQQTNDRPAWESTQAMQTGHGAAVTGSTANTSTANTSTAKTSTANVELWNYSETVFKGRTIEQLDVAPLGPRAPIPPGVSRLPAAGQYYASPALAALIRSTPSAELGARFPGALAGIIGDEALTGPDELTVYVGYPAAQLAALNGTVRVDRIADGAQSSVWTNYFRYAFGVGAVAFLFPILVLIGMATRLAAARREERFAALRLVGATNRQINVIASVDAVVGALLGTVLGFGIFALVRPALAGASLTGARYFPYLVTPSPLDYAGVLVCVPVAAAVASLMSLRRVRISPLGVSRRQTPPQPGARRVIPLALGIVLFLLGVATTNSRAIGVALYPGLLLILVGLVVGGPWMTAQASRLLMTLVKGVPALLAARRLADNPRAAFRAVSVLVLAVFLGTLLAGLLPAINATTATPSATALNNVLLDTFTYSSVCGNEVNCGGGGGPGPEVTPGHPLTAQQTIGFLGLPPAAGAALVSELHGFQGATVVPIYSMPQDLAFLSSLAAGADGGGSGNGGEAGHGPVNAPTPPEYNSIVNCQDLAALGALGSCAAGDKAIEADASSLSSDNPTFATDPIAGPRNPAASDSVSGLYLQAVLVRVADPTTLEVVRTFLATHTPLSESGAAPRTFGESVQARALVSAVLQRMVEILVVLTLLVAGCSLAVAVGGALVERKRPFSLMRLTGTPLSALHKVVLWEAAVPLAAATLVAAGTGYGLAALTALRMGPAGTPVPVLGDVYYLTMGGGLLASVAVIGSTLPFLGRITRPDNARFE